jgi:outer membrane protein assembly factor BamD
MKYQILITSFCLLVAACAASCAAGPTDTGKLSYTGSARQNYRKGVKALRKKELDEAKKFFKFVKNRFPLSKYAVLAKLRLADVLYNQGKFLSAIDAYQNFLKEHPTHREVESGYVPFRVGRAHWKMAPGDWWLFPPSHEKDRTPALATMKVFKRFLERFPDTKYTPKARKIYRKAVRRLARHELYVAKFYLSRGKPKGAILRLQHLIRKYPEAGFEPSVMLLLGKMYLKLKRIEKAVETFRGLMEKHPDDHNADRARLYLKHISKRYGQK